MRQLPTFEVDRGLAAEAGLHFLRLLAINCPHDYRDAYLAKYPLRGPDNAPSWDSASLDFFALMSGRAPDGDAIYRDLRAAFPAGSASGALPAEPAIAGQDQAGAAHAARAFLEWYGGLFSEPGPNSYPAWDSSRMEYSFALGARLPAGNGQPAEDVSLLAPGFRGGRLDWPSFDVSEENLGASDKPAAKLADGVPSPIRFGGMAARRFWEFDDAQIDFGAVDAGPEDLARMLLLKLVTSFGGGWFSVPLELPVGSIARVDRLVVTNTFGEQAEIAPYHQLDGDAAPGAAFRMFGLSRARSAGSEPQPPRPELLFLPPLLGPDHEGQPIEDVLLVRDEIADQHWAIERIVVGPSGSPVDRAADHRDQLRRNPPPPRRPPAPPASVAYRLQPAVPGPWTPLVTRSDDPSLLALGGVIADDGNARAPDVRGMILELRYANGVHRSEIPREGLRLLRRFRCARWSDGSLRLWIGRERGPASGGCRKGLRSDVLEP